jgi:DNA (cytosine-5)-methyltransferase 1
MKYVSLFSGIGGLESSNVLPEMLCDINPACRSALQLRFPSIPVWDDVCTLNPPLADVVAGGFPCQDISTGGKQAGFSGHRSSLFYQMLRVASECRASTIVAENVPNLIDMQGGAVMRAVIESLVEAGFDQIGWRLLNARQFGLPQQRNRVFLVASKCADVARSVHRPLPSVVSEDPSGAADGFYWTAGIQSICYSRGFAPTLKVGSSLSIPSPPAVFFDGVVRKLTAPECLRLQGFDPDAFVGIAEKNLLLMAGNAVPVPAGHFVMSGIQAPVHGLDLHESPQFGWSRYPRHGLYTDGVLFEVTHEHGPLASNLWDMIDRDNRAPLSCRASSGLLRRLQRSEKDCPAPLLEALRRLTVDSTTDQESVVRI